MSRDGWSLALAYGPRRRGFRLLLAYVLPLILVIAGIAFGIWREKVKADGVFDALEARLGAFPSRSQFQGGAAEVIREIAGNGERIQLELYDVATARLVATNARKDPHEQGMIELRFQRTIRALGTSWIVRQLRRTPPRQVLVAPATIVWLALVFLPIVLLMRPSLRRRSFELGPTMLDSLVDVIGVIDLQGRISYVSPSIRNNFGYEPEEVLDRHVQQLIHPDDQEKVAAAMERMKTSEAGETIRGVRIRDRHGTWHHVEGAGRRIVVHGRVVAILITLHDVTPVVTAHDELWLSEERFRRLFDSIHDHAMVITDLAGQVVSWNKAAERMTGYTAQEIVGQPITILRPEEEMRDADALERELSGVARGEGVEIEAWRVRKDGKRFLAHITRSPLPDRFGRLSGFSFIIRDITERRMIEEQLSQAQRLDSLGKLAGGIAHDFNNMLMVIFSRAELLPRASDDPERQRRFIEDIKTAAGKSRDLTQQLLAAARRQVMQPEVVDVNDVVTSTMQLLRPSIGEHIDIRLRLDPQLWPIYADPGKLHQVLMNLALNARDAMPSGGSLTIETRNFVASSAYVRQHPQLPQGDHVLLIVSDSGQGIPAEVQQRIYDPFFTTKPSGTGLGLAVVRGIVEQTGGQIWLYSEEQKGSTFRVFFPRHREATAHPASTIEAEAPNARGTETVLVVEDEALVRQIIRETLEEHGYLVLEAASAAEALSIGEEHSGPIHLLLTDVVMPVMNGRALAQELTSARPSLRVVFMSGYTDDVIAHHGVLEPGERFVEKPASAAVLLRAVRAALDSA